MQYKSYNLTLLDGSIFTAQKLLCCVYPSNCHASGVQHCFVSQLYAVFSIALLYSSVSVIQAVFSIALLYSSVTVSVLYKQCSALPCCVCQCYASSVQHCLAVFDSVMQAVFGIALLFVISSYASSVRTTLPCCVCIGVMQAVYSIALLCWSTGLYLHLSYNGASGVQHCLAVCLLVCTFICRTVLQVVCRTALLFICRTA